MSKWQIPATGGNMEVNNGIYYQNMTNRDVAERLKKNDVILIPVGSTENHGPSAPYGEDTYLDTRLCELVAERTGATVAQPIWYGSHPYHHLGQKGTIMIPEKILADYIAYVLAGFWNTGFRKIIIVVPLTVLLPNIPALGGMGGFLAEPISNLVGGLACFVTMYLTVYRKL